MALSRVSLPAAREAAVATGAYMSAEHEPEEPARASADGGALSDAPASSVLLTPDRGHLDKALVELAELVGEILRQADDDALLLRSGELPVLRRTNGRVVVSTRSEWTTPEALAAFGLLVELEDLGGVV